MQYGINYDLRICCFTKKKYKYINLSCIISRIMLNVFLVDKFIGGFMIFVLSRPLFFILAARSCNTVVAPSQILRSDIFAARCENVVDIEASCRFRHILYFHRKSTGMRMTTVVEYQGKNAVALLEFPVEGPIFLKELYEFFRHVIKML